MYPFAQCTFVEKQPTVSIASEPVLISVCPPARNSQGHHAVVPEHVAEHVAE